MIKYRTIVTDVGHGVPRLVLSSECAAIILIVLAGGSNILRDLLMLL